jgi:hypothetical protein
MSLVAVPANLHGQDAATRRVRAEGPPAWAAYEQAVQRASGRTTFLRTRNGQRQHEYSTEVLRGGGLSLHLRQFAHYERRGTTDPGMVWATNPLYAFHLERDSPAAPWVIRSLQRAAHPSAYRRQVEENDRGLSDPLAAVTLYGVSLRDLVAEPSFRAVSLTPTNHDGRPAFSLRFESVHPYTRADAYMPIQGGDLVLSDPHWLLLKHSTRWLKPAAIEVAGECVYADDEPVPLLKRATTRVSIPADKGTPAARLETTLTCELQPTVERLDADRFRLTAFGLTEPADLAPLAWYSRWEVWALVAAAGLIAAGWAVGRNRRAAK